MRAFLITLGALVLLVQPGPFLNDEVGQMAALTSLANGELLVQPDLPEGYDIYRGWGGHVVPSPGDAPHPNHGSTMTTTLALPFLAVLRVLEVPLGPMGAVGLLVSVAAGVAVWAWAADRAGSSGAADKPMDRQQPRRGLHGVDPRLLGATAGASLMLGAGLMQIHWRPHSSPYLEAASLQLVALCFHAFATALIYDLLRTRVDRPAVGAALFAFGTPALFWGLNLKYHGVAVSLAAICLWLYQEGHRTRPLRTALAFAVAGLAIWNHLPNGLLVLGSLSLMAVPAVLLGLRPLLGQVGAAAGGLAVGILPEVWDRMAHNAQGAQDRFIQVGGGAGTGEVQEQLTRQSEAGRLQWTAWNDPAGPFDAFWQMVFWVNRDTPEAGAALPMLALVPLLAVVAWAYRRPIIARMGGPLMVWPAVHLLLMLVLFGRGLFRNGDGFDLRHSATIWPFLAIPMAAILDRARIEPRIVARMGMAVVVSMLVVVWIPFYLARHGRGYSALLRGPTYDLVDPLRYVGVAGAAAVLVVWLVPRLRPRRMHATAGAVAWAFLVQVLLQLGPARTMGGWQPFVAWPTAILEAFVDRFVMGL